jgi:DNA ligase-1
MKLGTVLYGVTSNGNVKTWCAKVHGTPTEQPSDATIEIVTQTKLGGKEVTRQEIITEGKNVGKSNETTPYEQAVSEAESRYRKKVKKGYITTIPADLTVADTNALGLPRPMLAHPIDKVKKVEFPAYVQPKFDGHRAIVTKRDGVMLMYSRGGDEITTMGHILKHLEDKVWEGEFFDGELYVHGKKLQDIGSWIRKYREGLSEQVHLYLYDTMMDEPYELRQLKLRRTILDQSGPVKLAATQIVHDLAEAMNFRDTVIAEGYEGAMLRTPDKGYQAGKKSRTLLKLKMFDDTEFIITDVVEGKDRIVNEVELKVACFKCETDDGEEFEVTAYGDMYKKDEIWHNRAEYIGKTLTVQHSGYTKDNIPWHPVALRLREDI